MQLNGNENLLSAGAHLCVCVLSVVLAAVAVCEDEQVNALRSAASRFALRLEALRRTFKVLRLCPCLHPTVPLSSHLSSSIFLKIGISVLRLNGGKSTNDGIPRFR
jgi:hypothetical protein